MTERTVGELSRLSGVSVRTLHHYDEIGLVSPATRSSSGYRLYDEAALARLRKVLFYRELGFGLDAIAAMLADPELTTDTHLRRQHQLLREQIARKHELLTALEKEMGARDMGMALSPEEQFEVFGTDKVGGEWAEEAEQRWGETDGYRESRGRTAGYTKQDWLDLKAEADAGLREFAAAMTAGTPADSDAAMEMAEKHRAYLTRWFYDCSVEMHRGLAEMYIADSRFSATFDDVAPGLAKYVHDAIIANAERVKS